MTFFAPAVLFISILAAVVGCGGAATEAPAVVTVEAASDPLTIKPDPSLRDRLKVGEPLWAAVSATQTVAARLEVDQTRITRVGAPVMGRISQLAVQEGQRVRRGELLALLTSTGLSDAQMALLKALSEQQVAHRAVERAQQLLKADVIGVAELQRREAEYAQTSAELDAARDQLALMGMPPEAIEDLERTRRINSVTRIVASMDGTVLSRMLTLGQIVQPADTGFEIADLSSLWLQADVPEQNAGDLQVGAAVEAEIAAFPELKIRGTLSFVSATVNPETRTVRVRMTLPNPDGRFKPAMLATMTLKERAERRLVVPSSAVVREQDAEYVFVQQDSDTFRLRQVNLGLEFEGRRVLEAGVADTDKILVEGAFHLNNERRRQLLRGNEAD